MEVNFKIKLLGALANLKPIQDIAKLMYFLTGASTERQAVLAYNHISAGLKEMGETAIAETIINPIKQQEPGHFAFYNMSASAMVADRVLKPWQLFLTRVLREKSYGLVGTNSRDDFKADMGRVAARPGHRPRPRGLRPRDRPRRAAPAVGRPAGHDLPAVHPQGAARERRALPRARARPPTAG